MDFDQKVIKRLNYSILDLFADVGGMMRALTVFIELGVIVLGLKNIDDFLVTKLFYFPSSKNAKFFCKDRRRQALVKTAKL